MGASNLIARTGALCVPTYLRAPKLRLAGDHSARLARLIEETRRQLDRPLTSEEYRWLRIYVEATPDEEKAEKKFLVAGS